MKIILLEGGYVRGDAKAGSKHEVSDELGRELISAKVARLDDAEELQAAEIEGQRAELVALAEQLTGVQGQLQVAQAEIATKDARIAELTDEAAQTVGLRLHAESLQRALDERDAQIAGLEQALGVVKAAKASTDLPPDFPEREAFVAGGYATLEAVAQASDAELLKVRDVGDATLKKAREYLANLAQG